MKKLIFLLISFAFTTVIKAQSPTGLKASWIDKYGREFTITIPEGDVSYMRYDDDEFMYDNEGRIRYLINDGNYVNVMYDNEGRLRYIGDVNIMYNERGHVRYIGEMHIRYDSEGRYLGKSGKINN